MEIEKWFDVMNLTQWGRVKHICVGKLTAFRSTNAGVFSKILIEINTFYSSKYVSKIRLRNDVYLGLDVLSHTYDVYKH